MATEAGGGPSGGPVCPNCRQPLRENLRSEQIAAVGATDGPQLPIALTYCGSCGWTLSAIPAQRRMSFGEVGGRLEVANPDDPSTLAGQFQLRCRQLADETVTAGFTPGGWIGLINMMGAVDAARHLLSSGRVLPVTPWLIQRGRPELTMEHEITQTRWAELFTDDDRAEATRRLGGHAPSA